MDFGVQMFDQNWGRRDLNLEGGPHPLDGRMVEEQ